MRRPRRLCPQLEGALPEGYFIAELSYIPTSIYLSGPGEVLQALPMEFAMEAQSLVAISLEGSVG